MEEGTSKTIAANWEPFFKAGRKEKLISTLKESAITIKRISLDNFYHSVKDSTSNMVDQKLARNSEYFCTLIIVSFAYKPKIFEILFTFCLF